MLTLSRGPYAIAGVVVILLMAFAGRYGFHRDELYFIEGGHHPAWAQPDNPMLVPLLAAGWHDLTGGSLGWTTSWLRSSGRAPPSTGRPRSY